MESFIATNFLKLSTQSNIYLTTVINKVNGKNILLVATVRRKIFSLEYSIVDKKIEPVFKDIHFAYIPAGSEMVSVDAFNKSLTVDDFVIGLTIIRSTDAGYEYYLNIYCDNDIAFNNELNLENVAQNCENVELEFAPYGLYHIQLPPHVVDNNYETVWLLAGGDRRLHVYKESEEEHVHYEMPVEEFFPEFADIIGIVLCLDIQYYQQYTRRISAIGYECGSFCCKVVDTILQQTIYFISYNFEHVICDIKLFNLSSTCNSDEENYIGLVHQQNHEINMSYNLLVTTSIHGAHIYMDILENNLDDYCFLDNSDECDVVSCSLAGDVDFDGNIEMLIGTYGQQLLMYKYDREIRKWILSNQMTFPSPIHKIYYADLTEDGVKELIVVTVHGIHVYQHDHRYVSKILNTRMEKMLEEKNKSVSVS